MKKLALLIIVSLFTLQSSAQLKADAGYGENLINVHPFFGYASPQVSDVGLGISYERFLNEYISAKLPLNFGLTTGLYQTGIGIKLYPAGHERTVKYAVGPSILFTRSTDGYQVSKYDSTGMFFYTEEIENPLTQLGFALTNSLNVTVKKNIYIGTEMGLGLNYLNNYKEDLGSGVGIIRNQNPNVLFTFTFAMGYRF